MSVFPSSLRAAFLFGLLRIINFLQLLRRSTQPVAQSASRHSPIGSQHAFLAKFAGGGKHGGGGQRDAAVGGDGFAKLEFLHERDIRYSAAILEHLAFHKNGLVAEETIGARRSYGSRLTTAEDITPTGEGLGKCKIFIIL